MKSRDVHLERKLAARSGGAEGACSNVGSSAVAAPALGFTLVGVASLCAAPALAQEQEQEDAAESRSAAFQPVEGGKGEQVPGGPLLVYAYAAILVLLVAYVARLGALYAKNQSELDRVSRAIERGRKS